jgi:hypothetical protein
MLSFSCSVNICVRELPAVVSAILAPPHLVHFYPAGGLWVNRICTCCLSSSNFKDPGLIPKISACETVSHSFECCGFSQRTRSGYMRLALVSDQLWLYQVERIGESNTKPSICCGCHSWRI